MLKKINRLTKNKDFERNFKSGRSSYGRYFGIKYLANDKGILRATVIVGKKVSKKAVTRNLIKRRLREIIRLKMDKFKGFDLVVIVLPTALEAGFGQLQAEFEQILRKINLKQ